MKQTFNEIITKAISFRHYLHQYPEVTWNEYQTAQTIQALLTELNIPWKSMANTGTVGYLARKKKGKHIALRADIDALEMSEKTNLTYASKHQNCMHACGHDGHSATLMAAAMWLKQHEAQLSGPVSLIFQPAEEGGHGAQKMIQEGCLEGVDEIYGWHNWPAIKFGQAICPDGIVMAGNGMFTIEIIGTGGHSSQPEICRDPVLAGSAIVMALQQIVSRNIAPQKVAVVSVTSFDAISGFTTIPPKATLRGSIRISDNQMRDEIASLIARISADTARAYGAQAIVDFQNRYSATINHQANALKVRDVMADVMGKECFSDVMTPIMASEDFSYYLESIPGAYALIGSDDGDPKHAKACHNVEYDFNDQLIEPVSKMLCRLAGYEGDFN
jgi:hippurate hydrolase